jgi:hypothetical protein
MPVITDTNLCSKIPNNAGLYAKWAEKKTSLESFGQKYAIAPLVLIELLSGLAKPEPKYFQSDLRRFKFLAGEGKSEFLSFPRDFVLQTVLNVRSTVAAFRPSDFQQWLEVTCQAQNRGDLVNANVELYGSALFSFGLNPDIVVRQHADGKRAFIDAMERIRSRRTPISSRNVRSAMFLRRQNILPRPPDVVAITAALDAAHTFYEVMAELAMKTDYDFGAAEHSGDWVDYQLLYYLADPEMHIITGDRNLQTRVASSSHASRIHFLT